MKKPGKDIELERLNRYGGYTAAASWLASDSDNESFVFRKFDTLAALNLLYMQSEILELEERVKEMHRTTLESYDMDLKDAASTWETLVRQCQPGSGFGVVNQEEVARDGISRFKRFKEASIARVVSVVTVIVAAVFLIGTIVGFYFVRSPEVKLGMIAGLATAFAGSLGLITNAKRVEIFAATAAYAAVLVVFVSNSDLSTG